LEYGLDQQKRIEIHNLLVKSFASRRDILLKKMKIICFRHEKMESFEIIGDGKISSYGFCLPPACYENWELNIMVLWNIKFSCESDSSMGYDIKLRLGELEEVKEKLSSLPDYDFLSQYKIPLSKNSSFQLFSVCQYFSIDDPRGFSDEHPFLIN